MTPSRTVRPSSRSPRTPGGSACGPPRTHAILIAETLNHVPVTFLLAMDITHLIIAIVTFPPVDRWWELGR